tara:strand:+ start:1004 stop:2344 length:1341 start_codon:yes stop_codon:yes gene_type:complete
LRGQSQLKRDLTQGRIADHLFKLSLPMVVSITASMSFNLVDTYFVGKLGVDQLAALSFSFPVVLTILNLSIGLAIGTSSVLSRMLGEKKEKEVQSLSTIILLIGFALSVSMTLIGVSTISPLFRALGATPAQLDFAREYMLWAYPAMGLRLIAVSISGVYRANGITLIPSASMLVATLFNLVLDPILIFGIPELVTPLGITGAGIATLLGNLLALCFEFYMAAVKYKFFSFRDISFRSEKLKEVLRIAVPASIANSLNPIALNIANYLIAIEVSTLGVAGFGVATKIQFFSMIPILAMSAAIGPIVGQNHGSSQKQRAHSAMRLAFKICFLWGLVQAICLTAFAYPLSNLFTESTESIEYSSLYLNWVSVTLVGYSLVIIYSAILNALGEANKAFVIILSRSLGLFLTIYFILDAFSINSPVILAISGANLVMGAFVLYSFKTKVS